MKNDSIEPHVPRLYLERGLSSIVKELKEFARDAQNDSKYQERIPLLTQRYKRSLDYISDENGIPFLKKDKYLTSKEAIELIEVISKENLALKRLNLLNKLKLLSREDIYKENIPQTTTAQEVVFEYNLSKISAESRKYIQNSAKIKNNYF